MIPVLCAVMLLFGCLQPYSTGQGQQPAAGTQPAQPSAPLPTQNVTPPQQNATPPAPVPQQNVTPPQQNASPQPPPLPPAPYIPATNLSVDGLLSQEMNGISSPMGGPYTMKTYTWVSKELQAQQGDIVLNPTFDILFNNRTEQNLAGFIFKAYSPASGNSFAYGFAITANESIFLDHYLATGERIETDFMHSDPAMAHTLRNMTITSKEKFIGPDGRLLAVYAFQVDDLE